MRLCELAKKCGLGVYMGRAAMPSSLFVQRITVDSRDAGRWSIFAPILGYRMNGADFVNDAYGRGCRIFLSETDAPPKDDCIVLKTQNIRKSVAEIASCLYEKPQNKLKIIGITGTKGKTGIATALSRLLSYVGYRSSFVGTGGVRDASFQKVEKTRNTTPEPTALFRILSDSLYRGDRAVCLEVSSQALKDFRIYGIDFFATVFSSLGIDHICPSEHECFTDYIEAKRSFFRDYRYEYSFFNADDRYTPYMSFGAEKCIKCGFAEGADFRITDYAVTEYGSEYKINGVPFSSRMYAGHDAVNFSLAIAVASRLTGLDISEFGDPISEITIPGRYEKYSVLGRTFIIDYAHNMLSFTEVFKLTRRIFSGRIIAVFGSVGGRSFNRRRELAEASDRYADISIITADNPDGEPIEKICGEIASFYRYHRPYIITDREEAIHRAFEISNVGDVILLLGKGDEESMLVGGKEVPFSEKDIIEEIKVKNE